MKKYVLLTAVLSLFFILPQAQVHASVITDLQGQVQSLAKYVVYLEKLISGGSQLGAASSTTLSNQVSTTSVSNQCIQLYNNLSYGSLDLNKNGEVSVLQKFLNSQGASLHITGYFGRGTQRAVRDWQAKNGLNVTGIVGKGTRAKIHDITCGILTATSPTITSVTPASGPIGTPVTITGSGFSPIGNTINFTNGSKTIVMNGNSSTTYNSTNNGTTITFIVPQQVISACPPRPPVQMSTDSSGLPVSSSTSCDPAILPVNIGVYTVSVTTASGTVSNGMNFSVLPKGLYPVDSNNFSPTITSVTPASGPVATTITINGSNFSNLSGGNNVIFDGVTAGTASVNADGTLSYVIPRAQPIVCPQPQPSATSGLAITISCDPIPQVQLGDHTIAVKTSGGTSNTGKFTVINTIDANPAATTGTLKGQAIATAYCPTGKIPCQPTSQTYTNFGIKVYNGDTYVTQLKLQAGGSYSVNLTPGVYTIYPDYYTPNVSIMNLWTSNLPQYVTIQSGLTSYINFSVIYNQY